jgi:hypothetical protein
MSLLDQPTAASTRLRSLGRFDAVGYVALAALVLFWTWRALHDASVYDFGLAYQGGQSAATTGHPEHLATWTGTPLLAAVMAMVSRLVSSGTGGHLLTLVNVVLVVGTAAVVLQRLRGTLSPAWWWITAAALLSFGPIMSSVWQKQLNIIALVLALGGFELMRRRRSHAGAALIGLSVAFKPLAILLPFVLLARRETRRAGAWAVVYLVVVSIVAQALLAAHAGSASAFNPLLELQSFMDKSKLGTGWACWVENFAPGSLLCRVAGSYDPTFQRVVVLAGVALLGAWVVGSLRGRRALSWEVFAFTCAISPMVSPIDWSHYQLMLAPLFVLLVVRFSREGTEAGEWAGLGVAFVLASLMWRPYDTPIDLSRLGLPSTWTSFGILVADVAQFAQYVLILTGALWYARHRAVVQLQTRSEDTAHG